MRISLPGDGNNRATPVWTASRLTVKIVMPLKCASAETNEVRYTKTYEKLIRNARSPLTVGSLIRFKQKLNENFFRIFPVLCPQPQPGEAQLRPANPCSVRGDPSSAGR